MAFGATERVARFGSGVGTSPINFPDGVALKMVAGTQLLLNLHLFNTGVGELKGTSGTRMRTIAASDVKVLAEGLLAGPITLNLPPGETTVSTGYCTMSSDSTLFAVSPHMHTLGIYEKITAQSAGQGDITLFDGPYDFDEQSYHLLTPGIVLKKGDRVRVDCTHRNTTTNSRDVRREYPLGDVLLGDLPLPRGRQPVLLPELRLPTSAAASAGVRATSAIA